MPPRWPRQPDRNDLEYRRLDDRMNFAIHVAFSATCNSGLWFVHQLKQATWPWAKWVTLVWLMVIFFHGIYIFGIANYSVKSNG
ncbi:MAG: 2TM domain-containing protein [Spirulinaceae cyanobacterium]